MKKIYWFLRQTHKLAGTEMVTLNIVNLLAEKKDITLVVMGEENKNMAYPISPNVKTKYLNIPYKYSCVEEYMNEVNILLKPFAGAAGALFWFFRKCKYRKIIKSFTTKDDILIFSAYDNYLCAPRDRRVLFHFHFNAAFFFNFGISFGRHFHRVPDKYIFLTEETKKKVEAKYKKTKDNYFVHNPIRYTPSLNLDDHNNEIMFVGRYQGQKDPILALKIMLELKKMNFKCHLNMYGMGELHNKMVSFVERNKLEDYVSINGTTNKIKEKLNETDLLLVTSSFEGYSLALHEANSQSVPAVCRNWGDSCRELVINNVNGFVFDEVDPLPYALKIKELLEDREQLKALRESSYKHSFRMSPEAITNKWLEIFNEEEKIKLV